MARAWMVVGFAAAMLGAGCSSSSEDSSAAASVTGTVQGTAIPTTDAVGILSTVSHGSSSESATGVILTNVAHTCSVLQAHGNPPGASSLTIVVTASGGTVPTGSYPIMQGGGFGASASFTTEDASCNTTGSTQAFSGTVTLSTASATQVAGSFNVQFEGAMTPVTGTFSAPICTYSVPADAGMAACK